jgi:hypothetical protein
MIEQRIKNHRVNSSIPAWPERATPIAPCFVLWPTTYSAIGVARSALHYCNFHRKSLELDVWSFFGIWCLEFGALSATSAHALK